MTELELLVKKAVDKYGCSCVLESEELASYKIWKLHIAEENFEVVVYTSLELLGNISKEFWNSIRPQKTSPCKSTVQALIEDIGEIE